MCSYPTVPWTAFRRIEESHTHSWVWPSEQVVWVARKFWFGEKAFREVYLFGLLLHIAFDLVTSYGTMVFSLFPNYRAYFDVMFIIDPFLDLILLGGLVLGWKFAGVRGYKWGTCALTGYLVLNMGVTGFSMVQLDRWADE